LAAIEVRGADKTYPNGTHALQPVDLTIADGEFVTLLGPSGCGKSTLLKMIAGLLEGDNGEIRLWGEPIAPGAQLARRMAFVFQAPTLMPWADVQTNVRLPLDLEQVPRQQADARVREALALVGLEKFAHALPNALSGGMQMRVSIARALVEEPELLLMDEPFGALDEITRHNLDGELLELWRKKQAHGGVRHALHPRGRVPVHARRDDGRAPGPHRRRAAHRRALPALQEFMVSPPFSQYARRLQSSLREASAAGQPQAAR
jgi:NitT/TauT family transport system ATP-binding protein